MDQVSFGVFDWIDRGTGPVNRLYEERLKLLEAADDSGFFCYHLAEHHATPLGMAPSPALFLAAAAQHTSKIRLGPIRYPGSAISQSRNAFTLGRRRQR